MSMKDLETQWTGDVYEGLLSVAGQPLDLYLGRIHPLRVTAVVEHSDEHCDLPLFSLYFEPDRRTGSVVAVFFTRKLVAGRFHALDVTCTRLYTDSEVCYQHLLDKVASGKVRIKTSESGAFHRDELAHVVGLAMNNIHTFGGW